MTAPEEDLAESTPPSDHLMSEERDPEAPPEDAFEQSIPVDRRTGDPEIHRGLEVSEYDAVEQARIVEVDDEYR